MAKSSFFVEKGQNQVMLALDTNLETLQNYSNVSIFIFEIMKFNFFFQSNLIKFQGKCDSLTILKYASRIPGDYDDYSQLFPEILPSEYRDEFHKIFKWQSPFITRYRQYLSDINMMIRIPKSIALAEMRLHLTVS